MMVTHAFAKVGRPESNLKRDFFFSNISYNIGGLVFSLNDLENGILRGNKRPAGFHFSRPFSSGKYFEAKERACIAYMESTVVDISIPPPSFQPVSLRLSRSPLF